MRTCLRYRCYCLHNIPSVYTYVLHAGGTQALGLLVTGVLDILDLGGLVALVETNGDFVADSHLAARG